MKSVLVLGGGGIVGYAWECGVMAGLAEHGDPHAFDAFVGTSAGAIAGAQLASGRLPLHDSGPRNRLPSFPEFDMQVLGQVFGLWSRIERTSPESAAAIGRIARGVARDREAAWVEAMAAMITVREWPLKPLFIGAVDTESGERRLLDRDCGASLARAVAASSSVPGLFPSVAIGDRLYMDGQVHSSTNADLLLPFAPERVVILVPTNGLTGGAIGGHADRALEAEVEALREEGCEVLVKTPSADDAGRIGGYSLMDSSRAGAAFEVGLETGRAFGPQLR